MAKNAAEKGDSRGRFQNADVAAAERVLEAAVREAVRLLREANRPAWGGYTPPSATNDAHTRSSATLSLTLYIPQQHERQAVRDRARAILAHAAHAVEPLLRSAS